MELTKNLTVNHFISNNKCKEGKNLKKNTVVLFANKCTYKKSTKQQ